MRVPIDERFWAKVSIPADVITGCWLWTSNFFTNKRLPYGAFQVRRGLKRSAHRMSWEFLNGEIPGGLFVLHRCDNSICVNPSHLFLGTHADNMADMRAKGRSATGQRNSLVAHPEKRPRGERQWAAKLTAESVVEIRRLRDEGATLSSLGKRFGVRIGTIHCVVRRETWKHVP